MVEPCMMAMLEFTRIKDRVRFISISHLWSHMIRLPRLWTSFTFRLSFWSTGQHSIQDDVHQLPDWFRNCIFRLNLPMSKPTQVNRLHLFRRIQHLYLVQSLLLDDDRLLSVDNNWDDDPTQIDISLFCSALRALRLTSFQCRGLEPKIMRCLFTTSFVSGEHPQPLIHHWTNTLTHLGADVSDWIHESILPTLIGISRYVWSQLLSLQLGLSKMSAESIPLLTTILTRKRLPLLQSLDFESTLGVSQINPFRQSELLTQLFANIEHELNQLVTFKAKVDLPYKIYHHNASDKYYQVYHFSSRLTNLRLCFNDVNVYPYLASLRQLQTLTLNCSQLGPLILSFQLFTTIGHHNLPRLHTLGIEAFEDKKEKGNINDSREPHCNNVIGIMKTMVNLTSLELELDWYRSNIRSIWLESIHYFPNLLRLECSISQVPPLGLYESIALAPRLVDVNLRIPFKDLTRTIQAWSRRASTSSDVDVSTDALRSSFIPIHRLKLGMIAGFPPCSCISSNHIIPLQCLTQLTDLTLNGPFKQDTAARQVLADLLQLRSLTLGGDVDSYEMEIFVYWSQPPPYRRFPQLTTLQLKHYNQDWLSRSGHSTMLMIQLLVRIPHLHTLRIHGLNQSNDIGPIRSFLNELNQFGRQPQIELLFNIDGIGRFNVWADETEMSNTINVA